MKVVRYTVTFDLPCDENGEPHDVDNLRHMAKALAQLARTYNTTIGRRWTEDAQLIDHRHKREIYMEERYEL